MKFSALHEVVTTFIHNVSSPMLLLSASLMVGCSLGGEDARPLRMSELRGAARTIEVNEVTIARKTYQEAVANEQLLSRIRLVPILRSQYASSSLPEYRIFDIQPRSAYQLIGLRNADVLIAANDFILYEAVNFPKFMTLLQNEGSGEVEIRRGGKPLVLKITFAGE